MDDSDNRTEEREEQILIPVGNEETVEATGIYHLYALPGLGGFLGHCPRCEAERQSLGVPQPERPPVVQPIHAQNTRLSEQLLPREQFRVGLSRANGGGSEGKVFELGIKNSGKQLTLNQGKLLSAGGGCKYIN